MSDDVHDPLKRLDEIHVPDSRSAHMTYDLAGSHVYLSSLVLHRGVPVEVRQLFETAKNASLYTWFVYRFHQVAEMVAFQALEFALRTKAKSVGLESPPKKLGKRWGLSSLLTYAKENHWLSNDAYPSLPGMAYERASNEIVRRLMQEQTDPSGGFLVPEPTEAELAAAAATIDIPHILKETVPDIRNNLAHGSITLVPRSHSTLRMVSETINQLYERPEAEGCVRVAKV